jgi:hypothetical protein
MRTKPDASGLKSVAKTASPSAFSATAWLTPTNIFSGASGG